LRQRAHSARHEFCRPALCPANHREGEFTIGQYVVGPIAGKPLLPLALPFLGPDQRIAGASMS